MQADGPNIADSIAAVGQVLGAIFTAATAAVVVWLGNRDRRWRLADQADRDAAQARLVTVDMESVAEDGRDVRDMVRITNSSAGPVLDARVDAARSQRQ